MATCQSEGERPAVAVTQRMKLGVSSAPAHADGLRLRPPFPPAAE
jgi:hypothetical protein